MRFAQITIVLSMLAVARGQLTYNITQASAPGNRDKYRCLNNKKLSSWLPKCVYNCQLQANKVDGCASEDFVCHCVNHSKYSDSIEPCAIPPEAGGKGHCTKEDLDKALPVVQDMCNFYNATLYQDFEDCSQRLSQSVTYGIVMNEDIVVSS